MCHYPRLIYPIRSKQAEEEAAAAIAGAAGEGSVAGDAAARPPPRKYEGERHLGRDFYSKRLRLLLNQLVESGPPLSEPALLDDAQVGSAHGRMVWIDTMIY